MKKVSTVSLLLFSTIVIIPSLAKATSLSDLTAATTSTSINSGTNTLVWEWNTLTHASQPGLTLLDSGHSSDNGTQLFDVTLEGSAAVSNAFVTTANFVSNITGSGSHGYAIQAQAVNSDHNIAIVGTVGVNAAGNAGDAAVWGNATDTSGATYGIYGTNTSPSGYAGYFNNSAGGYAAAFMGGNVGIGTALPGALLDVVGPAAPLARLKADSSSLYGAFLWLDSTAITGGHAWSVGATGGSAGEGQGKLSIADETAAAYRLTIDTSGNVGISNTSPAYLLHVGSAAASGTVAEFQNSSGDCVFTPSASTLGISCASDIRLKKDITDSGSALAWLARLHIRDFAMKSTGEHGTGVIAQEVKEVHPDMVRMGSNGYYIVDAPNPWKLVKAIQEQQKEIEELKQEITRLTEKQGAL